LATAPIRTAITGKAADLRKVQLQVMRQDAVRGLRLGLRDRLVGLRQLLEIVDAGNQRVDIGLRDADPQHVQNDLGTLGIVLVPTVVQRLSRPGQCDGGDQPQLKAGCQRSVGERAMVVPGCLEADEDRRPIAARSSARRS
jgi:hypothetical protein